MRTILLFLVFLPCLLSGQKLKVDCGADTTFCSFLSTDTNIHIGSKVKIENGLAPYKYYWSCKGYKVGTIHIFYAKAFLSDTTMLNPYFKDRMLDKDTLTFYLTVEDNNNQSATDSITVRFSNFAYLMGYYQMYITAGSSIQFELLTVGGGIPPLKYYWTPSQGLSDSTETYPICKPLQSADYYVMAIDAVGCKSEFNLVCQVVVNPTIDQILTEPNKSIPRQVGTKLIFNNPQEQEVSFTLYSLSGKEVLHFFTNNSTVDLNEYGLNESFYLYKIKYSNTSESGKFINLKVK